MRQHSWYADTLGIDYQSLRLPTFLREIQAQLSDFEHWTSRPLELVPAPKAQRWRLDGDAWKPDEPRISRKLRPLAHAALHDQVVPTVLMMCLADRVETMTGDPRLPPESAINRRRVLAYGHRLFCDRKGDELRHRWGSSKLYRQHFQDYQSFLQRPKLVAEQLEHIAGRFEIAIVHSDLSKFYDRVRPKILHDKIRKLKTHADEDGFFALVERVFNWHWADSERAARFARENGIAGFGEIALPQGLVASGFFANVVLRDFEDSLRSRLGEVISNNPHLILEDACYYVDDIRLVLRIEVGLAEKLIAQHVSQWLQKLLDETAPGLEIEPAKTSATVEGRDRRFLVRQSRAANRIQHEVSGAFDMLHGTELVGAIEGFFHTQQRYPSSQTPEHTGRTGLLVGMSDMRDDTAIRFAAGKYRRTFRSLRPLLGSELAPQNTDYEEGTVEDEPQSALPRQLVLSKQQLDERAKLFAALLIEEWTTNPGNVRLMRIALDIYPGREFLEEVLRILRPGWEPGGVRGARREVRLYCLSELFRAGATETGFVQDNDCLPDGVSVDEYHIRLTQVAREIFERYLSASSIRRGLPWYLMQQVFLYLAARNAFPLDIRALRARGGRLLSQYRQFAKFLIGQPLNSLEERCIFLALAVTGFGNTLMLETFATQRVSPEFLAELAKISPPLAFQLWTRYRQTARGRVSQMARRLGLETFATTQASSVSALAATQTNPFYEEENLLRLAAWLFDRQPEEFGDVLTPWQIQCSITDNVPGYSFGKADSTSFALTSSPPRAVELFTPPEWCESTDDRQKFQIGLLLRFALRGSVDLYGSISRRSLTVRSRYKRPISHWEQQRYSIFEGRSGFGPPWLPISSATEDLLFHLLRWPGCGTSIPLKTLAELRRDTDLYLEKVAARRGEVTSATFLDYHAPWPDMPPPAPWERILRVGVVQSVIPDDRDFADHSNDPELLLDQPFRERHRRHLATVIEAVSQMLRVRETHRPQPASMGRVIDLLVLPELSVHPQDIDTIIVPFVRVHKCIVLCGQVYHPREVTPSSPLINSCLWLIPEWSSSGGFRIERIEQGKQHLAADELALQPVPVGFRPAQWLINYQWNSDPRERPLILTASVCYDATDLKLAADLRSRSDVYIVCALNRDVGTFDRMSEGLHYHMYQGIIVVNNGRFGGSSFYMPFGQHFHRQILHLHGQPQASISFAELSPRKLIGRPNNAPNEWPEGEWKAQPAAWQPF